MVRDWRVRRGCIDSVDGCEIWLVTAHKIR